MKMEQFLQTAPCGSKTWRILHIRNAAAQLLCLDPDALGWIMNFLPVKNIEMRWRRDFLSSASSGAFNLDWEKSYLLNCQLAGFITRWVVN